MSKNICVALCLLFALANGEKKVNLEDIERDILRAESKSKSENAQASETKYAANQEVSQQQYQISPNRYGGQAVQPSTYATSQQAQQVQNAPTENYAPPMKYPVDDDVLYRSPNDPRPLQYYQKQTEASLQRVSPQVFETQRDAIYHPELVTFDNQVQKQSPALENYAKTENKETIYVDIPMTHLLSHYPNLDIDSVVGAKIAGGQVHPQSQELTGQPAQRISIPLYTSVLGQKQFFAPIKMTYDVQPQYATKHLLPVTKGPTFNTALRLKKLQLSAQSIPSNYVVQPDRYAQGKKFLYTQAYIARPQQQQRQQYAQQYAQQLVYNQPDAHHTQATPVYADLSAQQPIYLQKNSLYDQTSLQNSQQQQQFYYFPAVIQQLSKQILHQQQETRNVAPDYIKVHQEPESNFVPPQIQAQDFIKSAVSQLPPTQPEVDESSVSAKNSIVSSEPRSLLDTYVPSNVIAAQDSARYRERPLKLESGFLPSKANFVSTYKEHKTE